jgi:hypothetical protein
MHDRENVLNPACDVNCTEKQPKCQCFVISLSWIVSRWAPSMYIGKPKGRLIFDFRDFRAVILEPSVPFSGRVCSHIRL